jgi:hypothetical protein
MSTITKTGQYIAATAEELRSNSVADKSAGIISQKALFRRRGTIELHAETLILSSWNDAGDLVLARSDIASVRTEFTELYGRFIGGLLNSGKPLILETATAGEIYVLIDRKELMETTKDREWAKAIDAWRRG